jgi:hypothetical protein
VDKTNQDKHQNVNNNNLFDDDDEDDFLAEGEKLHWLFCSR